MTVQIAVKLDDGLAEQVRNARISHRGGGQGGFVRYDDAEPVGLTRSFLAEPDRFPRHLLPDHAPRR